MTRGPAAPSGRRSSGTSTGVSHEPVPRHHRGEDVACVCAYGRPLSARQAIAERIAAAFNRGLEVRPHIAPPAPLPAPTGDGPLVLPVALNLLLGIANPVEYQQLTAGLLARYQKGVDTYGTPLRAHNGRPARVDAQEEILDALMYAAQAHMEASDEPARAATAAALELLVKARRALLGEVERQQPITLRIGEEQTVTPEPREDRRVRMETRRAEVPRLHAQAEIHNLLTELLDRARDVARDLPDAAEAEEAMWSLADKLLIASGLQLQVVERGYARFTSRARGTNHVFTVKLKSAEPSAELASQILANIQGEVAR
jgi:hypothetical protein